MPEQVNKRLAASKLDQMSQRELLIMLNALMDGVRAVAAKLDADATVTDTNYAATLDSYITKT